MEIAEVIVRMGWVTFLLICILTDGKIITDNILYILNVKIDKILSNKCTKNEIESGKDYGRFYMGDSGRTGFEVGAEGSQY